MTVLSLSLQIYSELFVGFLNLLNIGNARNSKVTRDCFSRLLHRMSEDFVY